MKSVKKSKKWQGLEKKLPNFEQSRDTIQKFNHEPLNLET